MRIALVHDWLTGMRGGEKCLEALCEVFPDADLYTLFYVPDRVSSIIRSMNVRASWLNRLPGVERYYRYCLPLFPRVIEGFDLENYDLILSSSHCVAKGILPRGAVHVSYLHSPMRYIWDQHDAYFGSDAAWAVRMGMGWWRDYLQQWDVRSSKRVDFFIANSRNIAAKIKTLYGRESAIIHAPVDVERFFVLEKQQPYYLIVSALVPYKKIDIAIDAFNRLKLPLKIAGDGPSKKSLEKIAGSNVQFLGWVDDEALPNLYASCQALIFPGEEDFGIVPLEAQASGRPVIAYGKGGVVETVIPLNRSGQHSASGESSTGIFFERLSRESLMAAVRLFSAQPKLFEPAAIREHACEFSRDRFKAQIQNFVDLCLRRRAAEK